MFFQIKNYLFWAINVLLTLRFALRIPDPVTGGALESGWVLYRQWRWPVDMLYGVTDVLMAPVRALYAAADPMLPNVGWFPQVKTYALYETLQRAFMTDKAFGPVVAWLQQPGMKNLFLGQFDMMALAAIVFFVLLNALIELGATEIAMWLQRISLLPTFNKGLCDVRRYEKKKKAAEKARRKNRKEGTGNLIQSAVMTDEETGLHNKRFFMTRLADIFYRTRQEEGLLSVAVIEIDHFHQVAEKHGVSVSETALKQLAQAAQTQLPADCYLCRYDRHSFALIMPQYMYENARRYIETLHESIHQTRFDTVSDLACTASVGMVTVDFRAPEGKSIFSVNELLKITEDQLRFARVNGRNQVQGQAIVPPEKTA